MHRRRVKRAGKFVYEEVTMQWPKLIRDYELPIQLGIVRISSLYSLLFSERFQLWFSHELPIQLGIVRISSLYSLPLSERFQLWFSHELPIQLGIVRILYSLSLSPYLVKNGTKCTRPGYNHIGSVVESAIDNYFGSVLFRLRNMLVGGKLVPLGKEPCGISGKILMPYFCSSIP